MSVRPHGTGKGWSLTRLPFVMDLGESPEAGDTAFLNDCPPSCRFSLSYVQSSTVIDGDNASDIQRKPAYLLSIISGKLLPENKVSSWLDPEHKSELNANLCSVAHLLPSLSADVGSELTTLMAGYPPSPILQHRKLLE